MADRTHIEWTDATWSPVTGCSVVSPGCTNCYAMRLAGTRLRDHPSRAGLTEPSKAGPVWNGAVQLNAAWLDKPLRWKKPRRIFVCAHGDLFHQAVPDAWIDQVFAIMALAPHHTFQLLTKRSARMRSYLTANTHNFGVPDWKARVCSAIDERVPWRTAVSSAARAKVAGDASLPNVWLGVSAEDQATADERIPDLLATPAAIRFLSAEPLLGPIDLTRIVSERDGEYVRGWDVVGRRLFEERRRGDIRVRTIDQPSTLPRLDLVISGGESGPHARPSHPDWHRRLRDACAAAGTAFFFKQWGEYRPTEWGDIGQFPDVEPAFALARNGARDTGKPFTLPDTGGPRPAWRAMSRVGKRAAGRRLDGREHNALPEAR